jgi:signal transduction histidine kinase/DNA-binding NarL/FixJ family response regulator
VNSATTKSLKILIIEDDSVARILLQEQLSRSLLPISVIKTASSLNSAFEILDESTFDLVLLDLNLPDSTGLDTLVTVTKKFPNVAIIVITGEDSDKLGLKTVAIGAQEYLKKTAYTTEILAKSIRYAIERKRTQEILDRKQRNLEAIFDASPIGMLLVDENTIVRRVNDVIRQMVRKAYSQIIGRKFCYALCCVNNTDADKNLESNTPCGKCLLQKTIVDVLDSWQPIHGVEVQPTLEVGDKEITPWLRISTEPVMIDGCRQVLIAIDDITAHKKAEEKLLETTEMKSQFISTVSHELRTPLAAMKESIAIVLDEITGRLNEKQKKFLSIAKRNVDRLSALVNDVLDYQRLEADRVKLHIQNNDISEVVTEVHETMVLVAKKKGVNLLFDLTGDLPKAKFDRSQIIQIMSNLISNGIKFTPEKGQVSVSVRQQNDELILTVRDTGVGIPKEELPKIFKRFYRVSMPNKQIQGTGLGLAIVNKIVMMHGGRIEVESELGKGTTFTMFLPLAGKCTPEPSPVAADQVVEDFLIKPKRK